MVTPAFSQAWIRAAPAISHQQQHHHHHRAPARRTLDRDLLSICPQSASTSAGSGMPTAAGAANPPIVSSTSAGRWAVAEKERVATPACRPARQAERANVCLNIVAAVTEEGAEGRLGSGRGGARTGSLSFSSDAFAVVVMDVVPSQPTHPEEPGARPPSLGPPIRPRSW